MDHKTKEAIIDINGIMKLIPHRYPFLLVDKIIEINEDKSIIGIKNVTANEPQFMGHFPDNPVMPGVLIIEALAQVSAILAAKFLNIKQEEQQVFLMTINEAKFRKIVRPGDTIFLKSEVVQHRANVWKFSAKAEVDGAIASECNLMAMIKNKEE